MIPQPFPIETRISVCETSQRFAQSGRLRDMTRAAHLLTGLLVATWMAGVGTSVLAQSNNARAFEATNTLNRSSQGIVQVYVATEAVSSEQLELPPNVDVGSLYRPLLESMLRRSPTFRRQCLRIANESDLVVHLQPFQGAVPEGVRAVTHFVKLPNGRLSADIQFNRLDHGVELIAHEFEHVIEQLDGVDLRSIAELADSGVHAVGPLGSLFETRRATRIGMRVAQEVRTDARRAD